jgi:hypothetical protein
MSATRNVIEPDDSPCGAYISRTSVRLVKTPIGTRQWRSSRSNFAATGYSHGPVTTSGRSSASPVASRPRSQTNSIGASPA